MLMERISFSDILIKRNTALRTATEFIKSGNTIVYYTDDSTKEKIEKRIGYSAIESGKLTVESLKINEITEKIRCLSQGVILVLDVSHLIDISEISNSVYLYYIG